MTASPWLRRYLLPFRSPRLPAESASTVVVGSGVAGLRAAIAAAAAGPVLLLTKGGPRDSNSWHAQGGIAMPLPGGDDRERHVADTLQAGQGLADPGVVAEIIREGEECVNELIGWGTQFDRRGRQLVRTLEGGHSRARILHCHGDATGRGLVEALSQRCLSLPTVRFCGHTFVVDLLTARGRCRGLLCWQPERGPFLVWSRSVILAAGGGGQLFRETTNPPEATGDGAALAYRAGAELADLEFFQFHPTTLYIAGSARTLISEAVRGEGARLVDRAGRSFMEGRDPRGDLAPRDVVSLGILEQIRRSGDTCVFLDASPIGRERFRRRFPRIWEACQSFGITPGKDLIPVRPSAHYQVGGARVDRRSRTAVPGLYACGECACTFLHGANRLGSNSLLEGLVTGRRAGEEAAAAAAKGPVRPARLTAADEGTAPPANLNLEDARNALKSQLWRKAGVERSERMCGEAADRIEQWGSYLYASNFDHPAGWELQNMLLLARLLVAAARTRRESRGVHFRSDHPQRDDRHWLKHQLFSRAGARTIPAAP